MLPQPYRIHQTSSQAVLVIPTPGARPDTLTTELSSTFDSYQINYQYKQHDGTVEHFSCSIWPQQLSDSSSELLTYSNLTKAEVSLSSQNVVLRFTKKTSAVDWQALRIVFDHDGDKEIVVKFVTAHNTSLLETKIRNSQLWASEDSHSKSTTTISQSVGNIQAKKVPGRNAIQITADLVPAVSSV